MDGQQLWLQGCSTRAKDDVGAVASSNGSLDVRAVHPKGRAQRTLGDDEDFVGLEGVVAHEFTGLGGKADVEDALEDEEALVAAGVHVRDDDTARRHVGDGVGDAADHRAENGRGGEVGREEGAAGGGHARAVREREVFRRKEGALRRLGEKVVVTQRRAGLSWPCTCMFIVRLYCLWLQPGG